MSRVESSARRLARALLGLGGRVLPASRRDWAAAMRGELHAIENDGQALGWAAGCAFACLAERIGSMAIFGSPLVRWGLALLVLAEAFSDLFAPVMTLSYRQGWIGFTAAMGGMTPGDDYRNFIPLMTQTPTWLFVLWALAGLLALLAAWKLVRGAGGAFVLFAAALGVHLLAVAVEPLIPGHAELTRQAFTFANHNVVRDQLIPAAKFAFPVVVVLLVWAVEQARRSRNLVAR